MTAYTLEEMKEHRRLWVEALRSGKYKQGESLLRSRDDHYCCLGVLCDLAGVKWEVGHDGNDDECWSVEDYNYAAAPQSVMNFVGLNSCFGSFGPGNDALSFMNDRGDSFSEIADLIESNPPGLFIDSAEDAR